MTNYYEILGLNSGAGILEIKASFRQLAKLYHPDVNPQGIEHFSKILKAYETLSDPGLKASYDYKLNYHQTQIEHQGKNKTSTKTWKFDERELKRRQYYNDHIKKYAKQTSEYMAEAETKKNYNEFRYVLFATPLAVVLFLLIMHLATENRDEAINKTTTKMYASSGIPAKNAVAKSDLKLGDAPYNMVFGSPKYDKIQNKTLTLKNLTGMEVIVCLFTKKEFIRCFYIKENISAEVSQLPDEKLYVNYCCGLNFDYLCVLNETNVQGSFTKDRAFYKSVKSKALNSFNEITLYKTHNEGFVEIDEKEFFKRAKK